MATATLRLKADRNLAPGWHGFMSWLAATHPQIYNQVRVTDPNTVEDIQNDTWPGSYLAGDDPAQKSALDRLAATITTIAGTVLPIVQQQQIVRAQIKRAKEGMPPLDVGAYVDPNQGVNVGLNPATRKVLYALAGGLGLAILLPRLLRRR
jgi:hypothetical protein